jgi:hypothetical protein
MGGLQAQYAPSMYIGLWSRVEGFQRDDLTRALEQKTVVQGTLLRATIHLVSAEDYWPFALAIGAARRKMSLRARRHLHAGDAEAAAARLRERLRDGPIRRKALEEVVGRDLVNTVGMWLDLVRVPPSGTWERRRADLYAAAQDWLGPPPPDLDVEAAVDHLVRRYLTGFGPARPADIADWAGLPMATVNPSLDRLPLRRLTTDDGVELVDLRSAPVPEPDVRAPVRFLPVWDATLLVHARGSGVLAEEHRPLIFNTKTPHSVNTFLVDGIVAGTWRYEKGRIVTEPFQPLDAPSQAELAEEADRLAALHA